MMILEHSATDLVTGNTAPRRIAVIDDDASIREALKSLMRSALFEVEAFASAEEFLESGQMGDTDCLILDVCLPGMSGLELQNRLNSERRNVPIVFITALADENARQRALKSGAIGFLDKPVRRDALFRAIQSAIERRY
jgi:FixJ family two-component response regulator